jgi:hypothetical protein
MDSKMKKNKRNKLAYSTSFGGNSKLWKEKCIEKKFNYN